MVSMAMVGWSATVSVKDLNVVVERRESEQTQGSLCRIAVHHTSR